MKMSVPRTSLLLSVITLAERDNYSFRSFKVSWASYGDAFADCICVTACGYLDFTRRLQLRRGKIR